MDIFFTDPDEIPFLFELACDRLQGRKLVGLEPDEASFQAFTQSTGRGHPGNAHRRAEAVAQHLHRSHQLAMDAHTAACAGVFGQLEIGRDPAIGRAAHDVAVVVPQTLWHDALPDMRLVSALRRDVLNSD